MHEENHSPEYHGFTRRSKRLSWVLRHKPDAVGLTLDSGGWALVDSLLLALDYSKEQLDELVNRSEKNRFEYSQDGQKVRACQGHSIPVDLGLVPKEPPDVLYHGTATHSVASIKREGLFKMDRHAVHLHEDKSLALSVGSRHGHPVLLEIRSGDMWRQGFEFCCSTNNVWLTEKVPPAFIQVLTS